MTRDAKTFISNIVFKKGEPQYIYWWGWKHENYKIDTHWAEFVTQEDYKEKLEKVANRPGFNHFITDSEIKSRNIPKLN